MSNSYVGRVLDGSPPEVVSAALVGLVTFVAVAMYSRRSQDRSKRVTSTQYDKPYRSVLHRVFNALLVVGEATGLVEAKPVVAKLLEKAKRVTGLDDYGDMWFVEPLTVLVDSMNNEAKLSAFGRFAQQETIVRILSNRLRIQALLKKHPEIHDIDIGKVIVISGLARTGTTCLHRLLGADSRARSLLAWEAVNPVPLEGETPGNPTKRIAAAKLMEQALHHIAPDLFTVHPIEHLSPEEDVFLLEMSFLSQIPEASMHVPTYAKWQAAQDYTRAYEYLHLCLKCLTFQNKREHWLLKTPDHMAHFDMLLKVLPQATIVQTHRDPLKTTASFCSMVAHGFGVMSDTVDPKQVGRHWLATAKTMMQRCIEVRKTAPADRFVDIMYKDLLKDPLGSVRKVYAAAGIPFTDAAECEVETVSKRNVQNRFGKHVYYPESFGLTDERIQAEYDFYCKAYNVPRE